MNLCKLVKDIKQVFYKEEYLASRNYTSTNMQVLNNLDTILDCAATAITHRLIIKDENLLTKHT